jgi:hypothetical protein
MSEVVKFDRNEAIRPHDKEFFEVYYLQSNPLPLPLPTSFPQNHFTLTHSGIVIRSTTSERVIVLEYRPMNETLCYLPLLAANPNKTLQIHWNHDAIIAMSKFIDEDYWQRSIYLTRINNVVYRQYLDWVGNYLMAHPVFLPYSICLPSGDCPYQKQTWDSFVSDSFEKLSEFAVTINPITQIYQTEWIYHTKYPPDRVLLSSDRAIIPYFSQLVTCLKGNSSAPLPSLLLFPFLLIIPSTDLSTNSSLDYISATNQCSKVTHASKVRREQHLLHLEDDVYLLLTPPSPPPVPPPTSSAPREDSSVYVTSSSTPIPLPPPPLPHFEKGSFTDFIILGAIGVLIAVGIVLALWKVGCLRQYSSLPSSQQRKQMRGGRLPDHERVLLISEEEEVDEDEEELEGNEMNEEGVEDRHREEERDPEMGRAGRGREVELQSRRIPPARGGRVNAADD